MDGRHGRDSMRVLLIGADSSIGRAVHDALMRSGIAEIVNVPGLPTAEALALQLPSVQGVLNCTTGGPAMIRSASEALYAAMRGRPLPIRIVHLGSMSVYGAATGIVREDCTERSGALRLGRYAEAQAQAERLLLALPDVIALRPGCEYGPGCEAWSERIAQWLLAGRIGDLGRAGEGICNLIYIDDLAAAIVAALQLPGPMRQVLNLAGDQPSWNSYFAQFSAALGVARPARPGSLRLWLDSHLLAMPLRLMELAARARGRRSAWPALPPSVLASCRQPIRLDTHAANSLLGLRWQPLDAGLQAAAAAFRSTWLAY